MLPKKWKAVAIDWLRVFTTSIAIGFFLNFIFNSSHFLDMSWKEVKIIVIFSLFIGISMWKGNELISTIIYKKYPWENNPSKTFRWNLIVSSIYNTVVLFLITTALAAYFTPGKFIFHDHIIGITINTIIVSLFSFFIWGAMFLKRFFEGYKSNIQKEEQHKRDIATYQYEMLKSQVNPHFLFNSLNVLTSLIETDSNAAVKFTRKLAEVYRYVLDAKDKETVPLSEELHLTESYIYMQKNRFGNNLKVTIKELPQNRHIIPVALQMLVENAIKHNVVTAEHPLTISIYEDQGYLVCENNLQKKSTLPDSNTIGLRNIKERYQFLSDRPMSFTESAGKFIVRLPLL